MELLNFTEHAVWVNAAVFAAAALGVWWAGTKLSAYVDLFAERTGIGRAFAGALMLGGATSLPEVATTLTASASGAAVLAGNNLIGGLAMQIAVLAALDAIALHGKALTFFSPQPALLMQGLMLIQLLALFIAAISCGELYTIAHVGLWPILFALAYLLALWVIYRYEDRSRWEPAGEIGQPPESARDLKDAHQEKYGELATRRVVGYFVASASAVLVGGYLVARTGEALAAQTGLGQSFIGATLVALTTSLPEVSTTWSAIRFGAYSMAAANILGTNCISVALLLPADLAFREGPIMEVLGQPSSFLAAIAIIVTGMYLWGVLERRDRTLWGMGLDSLAVLIVYVAGMAVFSTFG